MKKKTLFKFEIKKTEDPPRTGDKSKKKYFC